MQIHRNIVVCLVAGMLGVACSEKHPPQPQNTPPAAATRAQSESMPDQTSSTADDGNGETLSAAVAAGGIPTQYIAHFEQDKLTRIEETRQADRQRGTYEFYGARLMNYSGAALNSGAPLSIQFSLQGAVESAQSNGTTASDTDVSAIRSRGQLLRSHALAQRATRAHSVH